MCVCVCTNFNTSTDLESYQVSNDINLPQIRQNVNGRKVKTINESTEFPNVKNYVYRNFPRKFIWRFGEVRELETT